MASHSHQSVSPVLYDPGKIVLSDNQRIVVTSLGYLCLRVPGCTTLSESLNRATTCNDAIQGMTVLGVALTPALQTRSAAEQAQQNSPY